MDKRTTSLCLTYKWPCNPLLRILASIPPSCHSLLLCFKIRLEGLWGRDHAASYILRKSLFFFSQHWKCIYCADNFFLSSCFEMLKVHLCLIHIPFIPQSGIQERKVIHCSFHFIVTKMHSTGFFCPQNYPIMLTSAFYFVPLYLLLYMWVQPRNAVAVLVIIVLWLTNTKTLKTRLDLFLCDLV